MNITCPECKAEFNVESSAVIPKEQTLYMTLGYESDLLCAKSLGASIVAMEKLQRAVAADIGFKCVVFIKSIDYKPKKIKIGFTITKVGGKADE